MCKKIVFSIGIILLPFSAFSLDSQFSQWTYLHVKNKSLSKAQVLFQQRYFKKSEASLKKALYYKTSLSETMLNLVEVE